MTANELADKFNTYDEPHDWGIQAATMLRQQAQEIAMLKQIIDANNLQSDIGQLKKELALQKLSDISQEIEKTEDTECQYCKQGCFRCDARKALTDEEIDIETTRALNDLNGSDYQLIDVAQLIAKYLMQAILRKAQEK